MRADRLGAKGFTLIEVMVALMVLSLAALAIIRLEGATIRGAGTVSDTLLANTVAGNVAITALTDQRPPALGTSAGSESNGGQSWAWSRDVRSVGDGQALLIEVRVADPSGRVIGRRQMIRLIGGPPA